MILISKFIQKALGFFAKRRMGYKKIAWLLSTLEKSIHSGFGMKNRMYSNRVKIEALYLLSYQISIT